MKKQWLMNNQLDMAVEWGQPFIEQSVAVIVCPICLNRFSK